MLKYGFQKVDPKFQSETRVKELKPWFIEFMYKMASIGIINFVLLYCL